MKRISIVLCILVLHIAVRAQHLTPSEEVIKTAADNCMAKVSNEKADDAFSVLFKDYWKDKATAARAAMSMQREYREVLGKYQDTMGKPVPNGYEFIGVKRLGTSVVKLVYLQKNELFFLPWAFSFYRAADEWRLTYISFPDMATDDLKDFVITDPPGSKP